MDKLDYAIIGEMLNHQAFSPISGVSRRELCGGLRADCRTLHRRLCALAGRGFVGRGVPEGRAHTYYVTEKGVEAFEEAVK